MTWDPRRRRYGIDALLAEPGAWLAGRRVALLANQASLTADGAPTLEAVVLCDRPNLLGPRIDGPGLDPALRSFLGYLPSPYQHGLTLGELVDWATRDLGVDLRVVPQGGWRRDDPPPHPFVPPSPGLPTVESVRLYPGLVLLEGTNLSEGRGTTLPFQLLGAPWLEGYALARELGALDLPGLRFRPVTFRPRSDRHAGEPCEGVQLHVVDAAALRPLEAVVRILAHLRATRPEFAWVDAATLPWSRSPDAGEPWHEPVRGPLVDALTGDASVRSVVEGGLAFDVAADAWRAVARRFEVDAAPYRRHPAH